MFLQIGESIEKHYRGHGVLNRAIDVLLGNFCRQWCGKPS